MASRWWLLGLGAGALLLLSGGEASAEGAEMIADRKLFGADIFDWPSMPTWLDRLPAAGQPYRDQLADLAIRYSVHPALLASVVDLESGWYTKLNADGSGGDGHGWGAWQIDDRSHSAWLATNNPMDFYQAGLYAVGQVLVPGYQYMLQHGVPDPMATRAAIAAYNGGPGRALAALQKTGDPNNATWHSLYVPNIYKRLAPLL